MAAPTGSGKTGVFELALARELAVRYPFIIRSNLDTSSQDQLPARTLDPGMALLLVFKFGYFTLFITK